jgi:antitoxin YefM
MTTLTVSEARRTLFPLVKRVADDRVPVEIASPHGNVVVMAAEDFEAWQETAYLLASPANAERLRRSYADAMAGRTVEHDLDSA